MTKTKPKGGHLESLSLGKLFDYSIGLVPLDDQEAYNRVNKKRKEDAAYKKLTKMRQIFGAARRSTDRRAKQGV